MKIEPVKSYRTPRYPVACEYGDLRDDLLLYAPLSWKNKRLVAGALSLCLLSGCSAVAVNPDDGLGCSKTVQIVDGRIKICTEKTTGTRIAPLFIHGSGSGVYGCVILSPPVFVSEDEALRMIIERLKEEGVVFEKTECEVDDVDTTSTEPQCISISKTSKRNLVMDAYSKELNTGIKYISIENYFELGGAYNGSSVNPYDFIALAAKLREKLRTGTDMNAVIFYDPSQSFLDEDKYESCLGDEYRPSLFIESHSEEEFEKQRRKCTNQQNRKSAALLMEQVQDYVEWLRAADILKEQGEG